MLVRGGQRDLRPAAAAGRFSRRSECGLKSSMFLSFNCVSSSAQEAFWRMYTGTWDSPGEVFRSD